MRRALPSLGLLTLVALAACGGDSTGPQVVDVQGVWNYSNNFSSAAVGYSCTESGTVSISQSGSNFTGTADATWGTCSDSFGNIYDNTGVTTISGGQIDASNVSFQGGGCQFEATVSGDPANAMSGTETCTLAVSGTNYVFTGPFQASR
jgi:hypothetical protein